MDSPTMARPAGRLAAGQRMEHTQVAIAPRHGVELRAIDDIVHALRRKQQRRRRAVVPPLAVTQHRHQGGDRRAPIESNDPAVLLT